MKAIHTGSSSICFLTKRFFTSICLEGQGPPYTITIMFDNALSRYQSINVLWFFPTFMRNCNNWQTSQDSKVVVVPLMCNFWKHTIMIPLITHFKPRAHRFQTDKVYLQTVTSLQGAVTTEKEAWNDILALKSSSVFWSSSRNFRERIKKAAFFQKWKRLHTTLWPILWTLW